jgi:hypothetical protein
MLNVSVGVPMLNESKRFTHPVVLVLACTYGAEIRVTVEEPATSKVLNPHIGWGAMPGNRLTGASVAD